MNNLLSRRLGGFLLAASLLSFVSCKTDSPTPTGPMLPLSAGGSTTAHPTVFYDSTDYNSAPYVVVMDSDASHRTAVWSGPGVGMCWSPSSSILLWNNLDTLTAIDVSVNSNGVPVATNYRIIASKTYYKTDSVSFGGIGNGYSSLWSSTTSVNKIAVPLYQFRRPNLPNYLVLISPSGGAWDTLHTFRNYGSIFQGIAWSPDDSKIAVLIDSAFAWYSIVVINATTGATTDSIPLPTSAQDWNLVEWSRTGLNKLMLKNSTQAITYLTPTSGSSPSTNNVVSNWSGSGTWSPNNSSIMYDYETLNRKHTEYTISLKKLTPLTSTTTTVVSNFSTFPCPVNGIDIQGFHWHR